MIFTISFGDMGAVQNFSRDYIITKLDVRVRYDKERFREEGIEFAHRNVTVNFPPEITSGAASESRGNQKTSGSAQPGPHVGAGAAAAIATIQADEGEKKTKT